MKQLLLSIIFICFAGFLTAQTGVCLKSTEGTDFWFGFMESRNYNPDHFLEITVTAKETTNFQILVGPGEIPLNGTYTVQANNSLQVKIPWELVETIGSENIQDKGIRMLSQNPVNVYALNWDHNSADVAVIYPTASLGTEYFAMCYYPDIDETNPLTGNGRNSEFLIVATEDQTRVEIIPSRVTHGGVPKNSLITMTLNKGQVFQVQSENIQGSHLEGQGDLTGSYISANKPVAFFSGSLSTRIPVGQCCWDHLYEQIPPVHSWGMDYFLAPLKSREVDRYRIMAAHDNTTVHISGRQPVTLNRGEFHEMVARHNDPTRVLANKPVMVAQFSQSRDIDREFTGGDGDPFMIILSPVNQSRNDVTFVAYESPDIDYEGYEGITSYFINIIAATGEIENIRLNDEPVTAEFRKFPEGNYSYAQVKIDAGTHRLVNKNPDKGFLAYAYGFGGVESYGYGVGFNLDLTLDLGESAFFENDTLLLCFGDTLTLDAGPYFDSYLWDNGQTSQLRAVSSQGWYSVKTTTNDGCELEDEVFVLISRPTTNLETSFEVECHPYQAELIAGDDYQKYVWQDESGDTLSMAQEFAASETGKFSITVFDQYNCSSSDTMELIIHPVPGINFSGSAQVCGEYTSSLSVTLSGTADSIWNFENSIRWSSNNNSLQLLDTTNTSVNLLAEDWGNYEIYYHLRTIDNCERTDTFRIRFYPQPVSEFEFGANEQCTGYNQVLTFTGSARSSAEFHWNFNGSEILDTLNNQSYLVTLGANLNEPPSVSLYIDDNGCLSDTTVKYSGAMPNFTIDTGPTRGCDSLTVDFTGRLLTDDPIDFKWNFHDGSTNSNPSVNKKYTEPGFYKVNLTITNPVSQCTNSFTIDSMVRVFPTPVAEIAADPEFCYPDTTRLIYKNYIDSSFSLWEFEGMHKLSNGNDTVEVVFDNPTATVRLTVEEYGCVSDPLELQLKRKPVFDFHSQTNEGCEPFSTLIFAETTDNNIQFEWVQDTLPWPTENPRFYTASGPGKFDIRLIARSMETGCSDTLLKTDWIKVNPKPGANIRIDYPVAMIENARISFTNRTPDGEFFLWEFGDGNASEEYHAVHTYTEPGEYFAQLIAETSLGCKDTAGVTISVVPSAVYAPNAFRPSSPIEENRTFMPVRTGIDPYRFTLSIYNRQGRLVYETDSPIEAWDGTMPDGQPANMGNYIWIARYFDIQGFEREQKGQVLLIR